jgi:hypothetical protein
LCALHHCKTCQYHTYCMHRAESFFPLSLLAVCLFPLYSPAHTQSRIAGEGERRLGPAPARSGRSGLCEGGEWGFVREGKCWLYSKLIINLRINCPLYCPLYWMATGTQPLANGTDNKRQIRFPLPHTRPSTTLYLFFNPFCKLLCGYLTLLRLACGAYYY